MLQGLDWSPDGIHCAGCGSDMLVTIWKVTNQQPPRVLGGHSWIVHGLAWSPDGRLLASGAWDNAIRLWNAATGACVHLLRDLDHVDNNFYGVAWSPDGRLLASGSYQRVVQMWEVMAHTCLWVGHEQATRIRQVAWSPDGTRLASGGEDGSVCLWKASNGLLQGVDAVDDHRELFGIDQACDALQQCGARLPREGGRVDAPLGKPGRLGRLDGGDESATSPQNLADVFYQLRINSDHSPQRGESLNETVPQLVDQPLPGEEIRCTL